MSIIPAHTAWSHRGRNGQRPGSKNQARDLKTPHGSVLSEGIRQERDLNRAVPEQQIHRWVDDGGALAEGGDQERRKLTVTWTPVALNARLSAEQALYAFPRRSGGVVAEERVTLARIVARVDQGQLTLHAATQQLRQLIGRLLLLEEAQAAVSHRPGWPRTAQRHPVGR